MGTFCLYGVNRLLIKILSPAILYSQSVDISTLAAAELRFFHHMYGATIADLTIEISDNGGQSYNPIFSKSGDQGNQWNEEIISIAAYSGIVKFKITGTVGGSFTGDIAIDNFEVREGPQNDVGILGLSWYSTNQPPPFCTNGSVPDVTDDGRSLSLIHI